MKLQSDNINDTNPEVESILIEMLSKLTTSQRIARTLSFSSTILNLSKRAISRANPDKSKTELDLLFVRLHYGNELSDKLKLFLKNQQNG